MTTPPSCSETEQLFDLFIDGWFVQGWSCAMTGGDQTTELLFMLITFAAVGVSLFVTTGSLIIPSILGLLLAGMLFAVLPATAINVAMIVLLLVLSAGGLLVVYRAGAR